MFAETDDDAPSRKSAKGWPKVQDLTALPRGFGRPQLAKPVNDAPAAMPEPGEVGLPAAVASPATCTSESPYGEPSPCVHEAGHKGHHKNAAGETW